MSYKPYVCNLEKNLRSICSADSNYGKYCITNLIKVSAVGKSSWVTFTCPTKQLVWPLLIEKDWPSTPKSFRSSKIPVLVKGPPSAPILLISFRYVTTTYRIWFLSKEHLSFLFCNFFYPAGSTVYIASFFLWWLLLPFPRVQTFVKQQFCCHLSCVLFVTEYKYIYYIVSACLASRDYLTLDIGQFIFLVSIFWYPSFPCITVAFTENWCLILFDCTGHIGKTCIGAWRGHQGGN